MASSDLPANITANDKDDQQIPPTFLPVNNKISDPENSDTTNVETVKSNSAPPSDKNAESSNKRKRESTAATNTFDDAEETGEEHVVAAETIDVKEIEMKDAEPVQSSVDQNVKEIEMQDAEKVADDKPDIKKQQISIRNETVPDLNASGCEGEKNIEDSENGGEIGTNETVSDLNASERSESSKKQRSDEGGSGQEVLGEVATLLKQVQESETNAKLEVEVKVKKMEDGDVKENSEVKEDYPGRVSCT